MDFLQNAMQAQLAKQHSSKRRMLIFEKKPNKKAAKGSRRTSAGLFFALANRLFSDFEEHVRNQGRRD